MFPLFPLTFRFTILDVVGILEGRARIAKTCDLTQARNSKNVWFLFNYQQTEMKKYFHRYVFASTVKSTCISLQSEARAHQDKKVFTPKYKKQKWQWQAASYIAWISLRVWVLYAVKLPLHRKNSARSSSVHIDVLFFNPTQTLCR